MPAKVNHPKNDRPDPMTPPPPKEFKFKRGFFVAYGKTREIPLGKRLAARLVSHDGRQRIESKHSVYLPFEEFWMAYFHNVVTDLDGNLELYDVDESPEQSLAQVENLKLRSIE